MDRVTTRIPKQQIEEVEAMVEAGEFPNRSEAIRQAIREMVGEHRRDADDGRRPRVARTDGSGRDRAEWRWER